MKRYVIVGNGAAAIGCLEGIRSIDKASAVTIVSKERHHTYCRPLISYYLEGKTDLARMMYRPADFYEEKSCTVIYGECAERIDAEGKRVILHNGAAMDYDALCVTSGSSPFIPPMNGLDSVNKKFTFMTLDDALDIEKAIDKDSRILIIGAGLIGLKCAEGLSGRVGSIIVTDIAGRVLSSILDDQSARLVRGRLESEGISLLLGESVSLFEGDTAVMASGKRIEFDILVIAPGVRPNASLIRDIGGACGRGITVDKHMRTSLPDIYAAGDCTESTDISDKTVKVMALLPNAYMQGRCAGVNMAGGESVFDKATPMNSIGFFGLHIMTAGSSSCPADGGEVYEEITEASIKKLFIKKGRLVGFVLVGDVDRAGIYTDLIRSQTPLDSIDFDMLKKIPNLFAFNPNYREKKLGGVV
ncbi:MAG: NAD(P)/FAD-dependent oxidoreductase [Christensenellales bacterium]|jgi:NAD(P)H-nitrite reductase large subunit